MTFQAVSAETRLQRALRLLAESEAELAEHDAEIKRLTEAHFCIREAIVYNKALRSAVAQSRRDVIWAQDRIRFGCDQPDIEVLVEAQLLRLPVG
jgi:hypothetical protein